MKIDLVEIDNLLSYINEKIRFDDYNLVIGPNGSGKTNLIRILKFFSNYRIDDSKLKDISLINLELPANPSDILPFIKLRC